MKKTKPKEEFGNTLFLYKIKRTIYLQGKNGLKNNPTCTHRFYH